MLVRSASGNCIVTELNFFEIMEINAASDGMVQTFQVFLAQSFSHQIVTESTGGDCYFRLGMEA